MKQFFSKVLTILYIIFLLPALILFIPFLVFKIYILKQPVKKGESYNKNHAWIYALILWVLIISWNIYQNQFYYVSYVYACPQFQESSKCYKLRADFVPEECADDEYGKGIVKGDCRDPYPDKIYFNNGGSLTFTDCTMYKEDQWSCITQDGKEWDMQFAERLKLEKSKLLK